MQITFACPQCQESSRAEVPGPTSVIPCPHCQRFLAPTPEAWDDGKLNRCLVCPSKELFLRKDFSQKLGLTIVVAGLAASSVTWYFHMPVATYGILFATALLDVVLYLFVGNVLTCYHCRAEYRGLPNMDAHEGFDLEIHEKHRQQAARLKQAGSSGPG